MDSLIVTEQADVDNGGAVKKICTVEGFEHHPPRYDENMANAILIAAAPDMYNMLLEVVDGLEDKSTLSMWEQSVKHSAQQLLDRITNQKPQ